MSSRNAVQPPIDSGHCRAICDEIGDRLRILLDQEAGAIPQPLQFLLGRFAELDGEQAPSIVPAMDETIEWSTAA
jgi:hypothetical protein